MSSDRFQDSTIVVTGVTGQVARPLAIALARDNRVVGAARFSDVAARADL
jgi:UDP-glucuronate 4-epimerase